MNSYRRKHNLAVRTPNGFNPYCPVYQSCVTVVPLASSVKMDYTVKVDINM